MHPEDKQKFWNWRLTHLYCIRTKNEVDPKKPDSQISYCWPSEKGVNMVNRCQQVNRCQFIIKMNRHRLCHELFPKKPERWAPLPQGAWRARRRFGVVL